MRLFLFILLIIGFYQISFGQNVKYSSEDKRALRDYEEAVLLLKRSQFREAMEPLLDAVDEDPNFIEAWLSLGSASYRLSRDSSCIAYFEQAIKIDPDYKKSKYAYYVIGELKFKKADYQYALDYLEHYLRTAPAEPVKEKEARVMIRNCRFAIEALKHPFDYNITELAEHANSFQLQYFPAYSVDQQKLYFTRREGFVHYHDEDIYYCERDSTTNGWTKPRSISSNINSEYNEGAASLSADGRLLVFTSCDGRKGLGSCDIYVAEKEGNNWSKPTNMGKAINSTAWDAQPSLSADGRTVFFVSTRPGGSGGKDIWMSAKNRNGKWQPAVNLGKRINTNKDEISPFLHANGETIYFASQGHEGFGGLDIFMSELEEDSLWKFPVNLGAPLNDEQDQVSFHIASNGIEGIYTKERMFDGTFQSKLFTFDLPDSFRVSNQSVYLKGQVTDKSNGKPLASKIKVYRFNDDNYYSQLSSDKINGSYTLVLTEGYKYGVYVSSEGYLFKDFSFSLKDIDTFNQNLLNIELDPISVGATSVLGNIFFDYDEYTLQESSLSELRVIYYFLKKNRDVVVEIGGHSDSKGAAGYNMILSEKRAKTVYDFLLSKRVNPKQLTYKGYGQTKPLVTGVTNENEQENRRIEFKILKIGI